MTEDEAFIRSIVDRPGDDLPRLVYADWLDERDDPGGAYLRAELEWAKAKQTAGFLVLWLNGLVEGLDPVWVARVSRPPVGVCCDHLRGIGTTAPRTLARIWPTTEARVLRSITALFVDRPDLLSPLVLELREPGIRVSTSHSHFPCLGDVQEYRVREPFRLYNGVFAREIGSLRRSQTAAYSTGFVAVSVSGEVFFQYAVGDPDRAYSDRMASSVAEFLSRIQNLNSQT